MRILHIIDHLGQGGARTIVEALVKSNKDQGVFSLRKKTNEPEFDKMTIKRVHIHSSRAKYNLSCFDNLRKFIQHNPEISILHCHDIKSYIAGYWMKSRYFPDKKLIFHEHGRIFTNKSSYNLLLNKLQKKVDFFIAVSETTKKSLMRNAGIKPIKIVVLYNFADLSRFRRKNISWNIQKEKEKIAITDNEFIIGFVGRLHQIKGCDILIKSLPYLHFPYKVLIAGDGPQKRKLKKLVNKLNLKEKVIFLGYCKNPLFVYSLIDILVLPSRSEACPMVISEAATARVPVIASDIPSIKELIHNGEATMFEVNKPLNLSKVLIRIRSHKRQSPKRGKISEIIFASLSKYNKMLLKIYKLKGSS